jgi:hypothetical protein
MSFGLILFIVIWFALYFASVDIARRKGRPDFPLFLISFFLSPIVGLIVALCLSEKTSAAPHDLQSLAANSIAYSRREIPTAELIKPMMKEVHVARAGLDLGKMTIKQIRQKVAGGELDLVDDLYFDKGQNEWVPLGVLIEA